MRSAEYWIDTLALAAHPEGGFYRETYRSAGSMLPNGFEGQRSFSTAIYFLLRAKDKSMFHKIRSDEIWHFHAGGQLTIYVLTPEGVKAHKLGTEADAGEQLQVVVPANHWFGAVVSKGDYVLSGCTVAPGFDFNDFQMARREELIGEFPNDAGVINMLT